MLVEEVQNVGSVIASMCTKAGASGVLSEILARGFLATSFRDKDVSVGISYSPRFVRPKMSSKSWLIIHTFVAAIEQCSLHLC